MFFNDFIVHDHLMLQLCFGSLVLILPENQYSYPNRKLCDAVNVEGWGKEPFDVQSVAIQRQAKGM